jgi:hypothetical protein
MMDARELGRNPIRVYPAACNEKEGPRGCSPARGFKNKQQQGDDIVSALGQWELSVASALSACFESSRGMLLDPWAQDTNCIRGRKQPTWMAGRE